MAANRDAGEDREIQLPELDRPEVGHEEKDVNTWAVGKFAIALALVCIGTLLLLAGLFRYFQARESASQPAPIKGLNRDARRLPPLPRLQEAPILDLKQMRNAEDQILSSYGWVDQQRGVVRLPVGRAMDLLVQRGLPVRAASEPAAASGVTVPTESSLGQKMIVPGGPLASDTQ